MRWRIVALLAFIPLKHWRLRRRERVHNNAHSPTGHKKQARLRQAASGLLAQIGQFPDSDATLLIKECIDQTLGKVERAVPGGENILTIVDDAAGLFECGEINVGEAMAAGSGCAGSEQR